MSTPPPNESPLKGQRGLRRIANAFVSSCWGLKYAIEGEAAFRQELLLSAILIPLALWLPVTTVERVLLVGSVVLVLIVELLNSGVEATVDRIGFDVHHLSKRAKDMGSAAVLLALLLLALTWALIAGPLLLQV